MACLRQTFLFLRESVGEHLSLLTLETKTWGDDSRVGNVQKQVTAPRVSHRLCDPFTVILASYFFTVFFGITEDISRMKLTCVIVAALFLTACQLSAAASHARDKQEYPAVRRSDEKQDSEDLTLAKKCTEDSDFCDPTSHNCCSGTCIDEGGSGVCAIIPVIV